MKAVRPIKRFQTSLRRSLRFDPSSLLLMKKVARWVINSESLCSII